MSVFAEPKCHVRRHMGCRTVKNSCWERLTRNHVLVLLVIGAASFCCQLGRGGRLPLVPVLCVVGGQLSHVCHGKGIKQTADGGRAEEPQRQVCLWGFHSRDWAAHIFTHSLLLAFAERKYPLRCWNGQTGLGTTGRWQYLKQPGFSNPYQYSRGPVCYSTFIKISTSRRPKVTVQYCNQYRHFVAISHQCQLYIL